MCHLNFFKSKRKICLLRVIMVVYQFKRNPYTHHTCHCRTLKYFLWTRGILKEIKEYMMCLSQEKNVKSYEVDAQKKNSRKQELKNDAFLIK